MIEVHDATAVFRPHRHASLTQTSFRNVQSDQPRQDGEREERTIGREERLQDVWDTWINKQNRRGQVVFGNCKTQPRTVILGAKFGNTSQIS